MSTVNVVSFVLYLDDTHCNICNIYKYLCSIYKSVLNVQTYLSGCDRYFQWESWLYFDTTVQTCVNKIKKFLLNDNKSFTKEQIEKNATGNIDLDDVESIFTYTPITADRSLYSVCEESFHYFFKCLKKLNDMPKAWTLTDLQTKINEQQISNPAIKVCTYASALMECVKIYDFIINNKTVRIKTITCDANSKKQYKRSSRFEPIFEDNVNICIVRDADGIVSQQDCHNIRVFATDDTKVFYIPIIASMGCNLIPHAAGVNEIFPCKSYSRWLVAYKALIEQDYFRSKLNIIDLLAGTFGVKSKHELFENKLDMNFYNKQKHDIATKIETIINSNNQTLTSNKMFTNAFFRSFPGINRLDVELKDFKDFVRTGFDEILLLHIFREYVSIDMKFEIDDQHESSELLLSSKPNLDGEWEEKRKEKMQLIATNVNLEENKMINIKLPNPTSVSNWENYDLVSYLTNALKEGNNPVVQLDNRKIKKMQAYLNQIQVMFKKLNTYIDTFYLYILFCIDDLVDFRGDTYMYITIHNKYEMTDLMNKQYPFVKMYPFISSFNELVQTRGDNLKYKKKYIKYKKKYTILKKQVLVK